MGVREQGCVREGRVTKGRRGVRIIRPPKFLLPALPVIIISRLIGAFKLEVVHTLFCHGSMPICTDKIVRMSYVQTLQLCARITNVLSA